MAGCGIALLIIEDDREMLKLYYKFMKMSFPHIPIHTASTPEQAISVFKKHRHDIVISDVRLPHRDDGVKVACEICEIEPSTSIYFVTADSDITCDSHSRVKGNSCVKEVFHKPVDITALVDRVGEVIDWLCKR